LITGGERGVKGRMFEVPHEGRGIQEADSSNAQTRILHGVHPD
jgi:hypothetical protein